MSHHPRQAGLLRRLALAALAALAFIFAALPSASADGGAPNLAYVAGGGPGGNDLVVIDVAKRQVTATIPVGGAPAAVVLSADGRFAYVTQSAANSLAIVDAAARKVA